MTERIYIETVYSSNIKINHELLHAITRENSKFKDASLFFDGNFIMVRSFIKMPMCFNLNTIQGSESVVLTIDKIEEQKFKFNEDEGGIVKIGALLSYFRTKKKTNQKLSIVDSENSETRKNLALFLINKGFELLDYKLATLPSVEIKKKTKLRANYLFKIEAAVKIVDIDTAFNSFVLGVGQKKSYGFGLLNKLEV